LNDIALKIYKNYNETVKSNFDSKPLSNNFLEKKLIDFKAYE